MRDWAARHRWETVLGGILLATIVVNATLSPFFLGFGNFINLFWLSIEKIIVVVAMTFVIINGEIDLSVASVMGFSAAVMASAFAGGDIPFAVAIVLGLLAGARRCTDRPDARQEHESGKSSECSGADESPEHESLLW